MSSKVREIVDTAVESMIKQAPEQVGVDEQHPNVLILTYHICTLAQ